MWDQANDLLWVLRYSNSERQRHRYNTQRSKNYMVSYLNWKYQDEIIKCHICVYTYMPPDSCLFQAWTEFINPVRKAGQASWSILRAKENWLRWISDLFIVTLLKKKSRKAGELSGRLSLKPRVWTQVIYNFWGPASPRGALCVWEGMFCFDFASPLSILIYQSF